MKALAAAVLCAVLAAGCSDDTTVEEGEIAPALEKLNLDLRYRDIPEPYGIDEIVAGRASRYGVSVDFAVLVGDAKYTTDQPPVVPYVGISSGIGMGNTLVITNASNAYRRRHVKAGIAIDIEEAVRELMPGVPFTP